MISARGAVHEERSGPRLRAIPPLPRPGDVIAGKYSLVRLIGEGGMGVVFEATHVRLRQRLAIKVLRPDVPELDAVVARFEREARAAAQLQSIHTARVIDVDALPSGLPYIVLEYLEGRDLDAELGVTGAMSVPDAVDIVLQVAEAMAEAHALGIVHRDLKPSNLFICRVGDQPRRIVKVLDFGISKIESDDSRLTPSHAYFGTPYYAAPEQLRAASTADGRSDVWSLGSILFELLTGRTPFVGSISAVIAKVVADPVPWPTELRPELPRDLARIVMHALQRDPMQRFQNMREFAQALEPFGPSKSVADAVAEAPRGKGKLGEILVAEGLLTRNDLTRALAEQRRSGKLLGRVLLDLRLVSQVDLLTALAKQQGVIVTPEAPASMDRERVEREAHTAPPSRAQARRRSRSRTPWIAAALGLPLGIAAAVWLAGVMRAHVKAAGLVEAAAMQPASPIALVPARANAEPAMAGRTGALPAKSPIGPGLRPVHAGLDKGAAPRPAATFEPSGI